ncbi:MAG: hypothetical protein ACQET8_19930 [Bacillota bacterium]|nr:hypothetical protein [Fictibacillus phosphorivorans]
MKRTNVAHRLPRGKRVSATEINYFQSNNEYTLITQWISKLL